MHLGQFSVSLNVKDISDSLVFYERLGFAALPGVGGIEENWIILQNDAGVTIGLFQGMFPNNIMTFNPDPTVLDIREIHKGLKDDGAEFAMEQMETDSGPAHFAILDPDGNQLLFDQHS